MTQTNSSAKQLAVTWKQSGIGRTQVQKETIKALGFTRLQQTVIKPDNAAIRGMINAVKHLVEVKQV